MRKLLKKFMLWVMEERSKVKNMGAAISSVPISEDTPSIQASFRLGVIAAANGRILEVSTYKYNQHGPDWTTELFIVPDDQTLAECISTILTVKGLT
jgi:hypothetical protein